MAELCRGHVLLLFACLFILRGGLTSVWGPTSHSLCPVIVSISVLVLVCDSYSQNYISNIEQERKKRTEADSPQMLHLNMSTALF